MNIVHASAFTNDQAIKFGNKIRVLDVYLKNQTEYYTTK